MVTFVPTVNVHAVVESNIRMPLVPSPTVKLLQTAAVSIVTVSPFLIVTLSVDIGTPPAPPLHPADQVAAELQFPPPLPFEVHRGAGALNMSELLLAKIVEDQRSEIRGRRSAPVACAGGFIHACSLNHERDE